MHLQLPAPRLLPLTIVALAALIGVKSVDLVRASTSGSAVPAAQAAPAPSPAAPAPTSAPAPAPGGPVQAGAASGNAPPDAGSAPIPPPEQIMPSAPPIPDSERALLLDLRARDKQLDQKAAALSTREVAVNAAEKRLAARLEELNSLQKRLEALDTERKAHDEANWEGLVKLYETMKPRDAATIFNDLDMPVLLPVLDRMNGRKAAAILAAMQPERARMVTAELAEMRTKEVTPATN